MYDTSKLTLDTPVKIKIMNSGIYVPELKTYTPLESYASIDDCISIMNRGIEITFPQQTKNEITEKIEDILLEYEELRNKVKKTHGDVGTSVSVALDVVQEINDSKLTEEDIQHEKDQHIFDFEDISTRIARNLKNGDEMFRIKNVFNENVDRLNEEEKLRKSRERNSIRKKEAMELAALEAETFNKLAQSGQFENAFDDSFVQMDFYDVTPD
jgi:ribosomal protein RSM22 (predicted rRNA methylase)